MDVDVKHWLEGYRNILTRFEKLTGMTVVPIILGDNAFR